MHRTVEISYIRECKESFRNLFHVGLSFQLLLEHETFPTLEIFNDFLLCGKDDASDSDMLIKWKPFTIEIEEYEELVASFCSDGHSININSFNKTNYIDWFDSLVNSR